MAERLAVDVTNTRETKFFGKRWDDRYPCTGNKITRILTKIWEVMWHEATVILQIQNCQILLFIVG
jgi:hypothetical protein